MPPGHLPGRLSRRQSFSCPKQGLQAHCFLGILLAAPVLSLCQGWVLAGCLFASAYPGFNWQAPRTCPALILLHPGRAIDHQVCSALWICPQSMHSFNTSSISRTRRPLPKSSDPVLEQCDAGVCRSSCRRWHLREASPPRREDGHLYVKRQIDVRHCILRAPCCTAGQLLL